MVKRDYGRDLDIGVPRDEALNVRVSIDEAIGDALNEKVTTVLNGTNLKLTEIETNTALAIGKDLGVEVD